jgi:hypothetical protein
MEGKMAGDRFAEVLQELDAVQQQLNEPPDNDFARRQNLRDRVEALRAELRAYSVEHTDEMSINQLKRLIASVERRLEDHYGNRLSHTSGPQSAGGGGLDPTILHEAHRAMDRSADLPGMKAELSRLMDKLTILEGK